MKIIKDENGYRADHYKLYPMLGLTAGGKLPDEGFPPREVQGVWLKCGPKTSTMRPDPYSHKGCRRGKVTSRIHQQCDECGVWVPYGRNTQHVCKPDVKAAFQEVKGHLTGVDLEGIQVIGLDDPATLHSVIAEAVGEKNGQSQ